MTNEDMETGDSWKISIPYQLFSKAKGSLIGKVNRKTQCICIYGLIHDIPYSKDGSEVSCGYWTAEKGCDNFHVPSSCEVWAYVTLEDTSTPCTRIFIKVGESFVEVTCTCIIIDVDDISESLLLKHRIPKLNETSEPELSLLEALYHCYSSEEIASLLGNRHYESWKAKQDSDKFMRKKVLCTPVTVIFWIFSFLASLLFNRFTQMKYMKSMFDIPTVFHHIKARALKYSSSITSQKILRSQNLYIGQIVDSLLGTLLMIYLTSGTTTDDISVAAMSYGETAAIELTNLLNWLMGAPAGLKLNSHLTKFLGHFYLYHVYLWSGYLTILKPVLSSLLWYSSLVGILGLSMQLALLQDIFSTFTVHLYCFYVYAARLFRGKKWNVLRKRVDSASYDVDQLFVGTLLLTILLFLLPTTGLYYVVFTLMRIIIISIQGIVAKVIFLLNDFPLYTLFLWICRSKKVAGDILLTAVQHQPSQDCLLLALQTTQTPLKKLLQMTQEEIQTPARYTNGDIIKKIMNGHLIYPWIETHH